MDFETALARSPLLAILRGLPPAEALPVGEALVAAGVTLLEVPLSAPEPLRSVALLVEHIGDRALIGVGGVTRMSDLQAVAASGARVAVSPHTDPALIARALALDLLPLPGVLTASEAFLALQAGASALLLFPAQASAPAALASLRAVLPSRVPLLPTGGITPDRMGHWWAAGARGFGLGGTLYRPGRPPREVAARARACLGALKGPLPSSP